MCMLVAIHRSVAAFLFSIPASGDCAKGFKDDDCLLTSFFFLHMRMRKQLQE
jgi:hypothetical protein